MFSTKKITHIKSLHQKKYRQKYGQFLIEGIKSNEEFLNAGWKPVQFFIKEGVSINLTIDKADVLSAAQMQSISYFKTASEVIGVYEIAKEKVVFNDLNNIIVLDNINDPGNFGTIIRLADWYGIDQIWVSPNTVDTYNPKVISASMGSLARIKIIRGEIFPLFSTSTYVKYAAALSGVSLQATEKPNKPFALCIGSESHGLNQQFFDTPHIQTITISRIGEAESLNAAIATAIILEKLVNG